MDKNKPVDINEFRFNSLLKTARTLATKVMDNVVEFYEVQCKDIPGTAMFNFVMDRGDTVIDHIDMLEIDADLKVKSEMKVALLSMATVQPSDFDMLTQEQKKDYTFLTIEAKRPTEISQLITNPTLKSGLVELEAYIQDYITEQGNLTWPFFCYVVRALEYIRLFSRFIIEENDGKIIVIRVKPHDYNEEIMVTINLNVGVRDGQFFKSYYGDI